MSVHVEACPQLYHAIQAIKALGAGAGVAINPGTDVARIEDVLTLVDYVLVMTVNPGFGGQRLIASALDKVPRLRRMLPAGVAIEVDGGVHRDNIRQVVEAGANWLVAGSAVFGAADPGGGGAAAAAGALTALGSGTAPARGRRFLAWQGAAPVVDSVAQYVDAYRYVVFGVG